MNQLITSIWAAATCFAMLTDHHTIGMMLLIVLAGYVGSCLTIEYDELKDNQKGR